MYNPTGYEFDSSIGQFYETMDDGVAYINGVYDKNCQSHFQPFDPTYEKHAGIESFSDESCFKDPTGNTICTYTRLRRQRINGPCGPNEDRYSMFCYNKPHEGYICRDNKCIKIIKKDVEPFEGETCTTNDKGVTTCTYDRNRRPILFGKCKDNEEKSGMFCYEKPQRWYNCNGKKCTKITYAPVCTKDGDGNETCKYTRDKLQTTTGECVADEERLGVYCYKKPLEGYTCTNETCLKYTPAIPKPSCSIDDTGETCTYKRQGIIKSDKSGKYVPCGPNEELVDTICYPKPLEGYTCKGNICTKFTPKNPPVTPPMAPKITPVQPIAPPPIPKPSTPSISARPVIQPEPIPSVSPSPFDLFKSAWFVYR